MRPIRVLHLLHSMNRGGAENALMNYYREIDRDKIQFDFLLTDQNHCSFEDEIIDLGGHVYRVSPLSIRNPFPYLKGVMSFLKSHPEYKIIHSHTSSKSVLPLFIAKYLGIPIRISHSHNSCSEQGLKGILRESLMPLLKYTANVYMSCGEKAAKWLYGERYFKLGKVEIFRNVINAELFRLNIEKRQKLRTELNISLDTLVIGHVARFSTQKNHLFALEVFKDFLLLHPNSIYLLVGDGELRSEIKNKAEELRIADKVRFVGIVPNVYDYEQIMDVFVLPSLFEGLPLSIIEAQVSGLPCITTADTVSSECAITDLVRFVSLSETSSKWAAEYYKAAKLIRKDRFEEVKLAGYDSACSGKLLQERYLELFDQMCGER